MRERIGPLQKKILLLLEAGVSLVFAYSPSQQRRVYKELAKELQKVNRATLKMAIDSLYASRIIDFKEGAGGLVSITLLDKGKKRLLAYQLDKMVIKKPVHWDKRWRIIVFDIPHEIKKVRDAFRGHLKQLGFHELQESVWIIPYSCDDEVEFLIEFYAIRSYVRQIIATKIDNELHLKHIFSLPS